MCLCFGVNNVEIKKVFVAQIKGVAEMSLDLVDLQRKFASLLVDARMNEGHKLRFTSFWFRFQSQPDPLKEQSMWTPARNISLKEQFDSFPHLPRRL